VVFYFFVDSLLLLAHPTALLGGEDETLLMSDVAEEIQKSGSHLQSNVFRGNGLVGPGGRVVGEVEFI
jgi:hypothetical protein